MLVIASKDLSAPPENVTSDLAVVDGKDQPLDSVWFGHPVRISCELKDGTIVSMTLSKGEATQLYRALHGDENIRRWAEISEYFETKESAS